MNRRISPHAPRLRQDSTDAEQRLWHELRGRRLEGHKFKRQWTLGPYVVDFCCWEQRLVVEVDGSQHSDEIDAPRTEWLNSRGYRVIRFWNNDVVTNMDGVLQTILAALKTHPHPNPLPQAGEGANEAPGRTPSPARGRRLG
ncbi:MAG TPA: endonuclease domain-containing protein [Allosphingosinicella sp.]